jgi:hypothetical protein
MRVLFSSFTGWTRNIGKFHTVAWRLYIYDYLFALQLCYLGRNTQTAVPSKQKKRKERARVVLLDKTPGCSLFSVLLSLLLHTA